MQGGCSISGESCLSNTILKIFLSFFQSKIQHPIPAYAFWEYYIKNGIEEAGYEWTEHPDIDWAQGLVPQSKTAHAAWKLNAWEKTITYLKLNPVDVFLSYLYPQQIDVSAINEIKKMGIPCVNFFCDNVREFKAAPKQFACFTLNWVTEYKATDLYKAAKYPYINLPMPMWINPLQRVLTPETFNQVTFIGSKDVQRQLFFEQLVQHAPSMPLAIYGKGWADTEAVNQPWANDYTFNKKLRFQYAFISQHGLIPYLRKLTNPREGSISALLKEKIHYSPSFDLYNKLTAQSNVVLGVNRYPSFNYPLLKPDTYSRLRDIEAPMLGACYLTEWTAGLDQLYDIENEIWIYKSVEELTEKVKQLQKDASLRNKLKLNGQKRALDNHSIPQSLLKIFKKLSLSLRGN